MSTEKPSFPEFDSKDADVCISQMYKWTVFHAEDQITYYADKAKNNKNLSIVIRGVSVVLAGIGALFPLIDAAMAVNGEKAFIWGQWGYVILAVGAGLYGFERTYGFSSGWIRFMQANLKLTRMLNNFRYEFSLLMNTPAGKPETGENQPNVKERERLIQALNKFCDKVDAVVMEETEAWVQEFQSRIAELEKRLKIETKKDKIKNSKSEPDDETAPTGEILVTIRTQIEYSSYAIYMDDKLKETLTGSSEYSIKTSPGKHQVKVNGLVNDEVKKTETVEIDVKAGERIQVPVEL